MNQYLNADNNEMINVRIKRYCEPLGLTLLLMSFCWQCWEEHSNQMKIDGYVYGISQDLTSIWDGIYDEALHSDRYHGSASVSINYDSHNDGVSDINRISKRLSTLDKQTSFMFWSRFVLYLVGSVLVIVGKWPNYDNDNMPCHHGM